MVAQTASAGFAAEKSPYPTVASVVIAQYSAKMYLRGASLASRGAQHLRCWCDALFKTRLVLQKKADIVYGRPSPPMKTSWLACGKQCLYLSNLIDPHKSHLALHQVSKRSPDGNGHVDDVVKVAANPGVLVQAMLERNEVKRARRPVRDVQDVLQPQVSPPQPPVS